MCKPLQIFSHIFIHILINNTVFCNKIKHKKVNNRWHTLKYISRTKSVTNRKKQARGNGTNREAWRWARCKTAAWAKSFTVLMLVSQEIHLQWQRWNFFFFFLKSSNTMKRLNMTQQRKQFFFTVWTANKHPSAGKKGWDAVSLLLGGICWFQVALQ